MGVKIRAMLTEEQAIRIEKARLAVANARVFVDDMQVIEPNFFGLLDLEISRLCGALDRRAVDGDYVRATIAMLASCMLDVMRCEKPILVFCGEMRRESEGGAA